MTRTRRQTGPQPAVMLALAATAALLAACGDRLDGPHVDFAITHTDQLEQEGSSSLDLPPEPAVVEGGTAAVDAHGLIAAPDACDDLGAHLEASDSVLALRVIVRGSRTHLGQCGDPGKFALVQWRARIRGLDPGAYHVRVLYDYRGVRSHSAGEKTAGRDPYPDRIVVERMVVIH